MTIDLKNKTKYRVKYTNNFKKDYKKICKQGKDINKLKYIIYLLANDEQLDEKYRNHHLINNKKYVDYNECHIEPDWLLIYKYTKSELVLLLVETGSHSELFND